MKLNSILQVTEKYTCECGSCFDENLFCFGSRHDSSGFRYLLLKLLRQSLNVLSMQTILLEIFHVSKARDILCYNII